MSRCNLRGAFVLSIVLAVFILALPAGAAAPARVGAAAPAGTTVTAPASATADAGPLKQITIFKAGTGQGFDYLTVDSKAKRLYVSHGSEVVVLDANDGKVIGSIADTPGIHGIALVADSNEGYTSNGRENKLSVFDRKTLKTLRKVDAGQNPDSIIYDPASKKIFAFNQRSGDITIVDTTASTPTKQTLQVGGVLESGISDGAGHVYVNVEDKSEIVAIDSKENKVLAHWSIAPGQGPTGLAIDREHHRLFSVCGNQMMVVIDPNNGKVLATVPIGPGCDGVTFNAKLGLAISSNGGNGTVTAVKEEPSGKFTAVQTLSTARGARTITSDPVSNFIYLPCNTRGGDGQIQFLIIVLGPAKT